MLWVWLDDRVELGFCFIVRRCVGSIFRKEDLLFLEKYRVVESLRWGLGWFWVRFSVYFSC